VTKVGVGDGWGDLLIVMRTEKSQQVQFRAAPVIRPPTPRLIVELQ